ncbi:MAG TPA: hypothetical protein PK413_12615 [Thermoanaerobaculia bacterium]|nr:hypothetical protein [Thermoanaerobaculia bacterium]
MRIRWLLLAAGFCDAATGIALLLAPLATLGLMGIEDGPRDPALLRFVGAFVLGVGAFYLRVLLGRPRPEQLATLLGGTALIRCLVGSYVSVALFAGWLPLPWVSVALTDLALALIQWTLLAGGKLDEPRSIG